MPTLYFAMGVPMITVSVVASIMYKNLGLSNTDITLYTGLMYLPWVAKALWSPLIDLFLTKRFFVICTQLAMAAGLGCIALTLPLPSYLAISLALFWVIGFLSATHDIAADGVYINAMTAKEQARYIGLQGVCWYGGKILASGLLVSFTGYLHSAKIGLGYSWVKSWMIVMGLMGATMLVLGIWHWVFLPSGGAASRSSERHTGFAVMAREFADVFVSYFRKKDIALMLAYVLLYRVGEGLIEKLGPLFLIDKPDVGGLGLDNIAVGNINGTFGSAAFIIGALIGGWIASRFGLKRSLMFLCLMLNVPHLTYIYLSIALPANITLITVIFSIEKLGYGIGSVALMLYMMQQVAPGPYKTAHYAISTGFMALCMMLTGMVSGKLEDLVGYKWFFLIAMIATVPSLIVTWFAPFNQPDATEATAAH
jgi:PAT family beta-lactamase induction signal transducer AmpG